MTGGSHALPRRLALATALVLAGAAVIALMRCRGPAPQHASATRPTARMDGLAVTVVDDAVRIASASDRALEGATTELFALRGETIAFQIVVEATAGFVRGVTVDLDGLNGVSTERFVTFELPMDRRSGGRQPGVSLGWDDGAEPPGRGETVVDPLIPIALADHPAAATASPPWDHPMTVPAGQRRVMWVELFVEERAPVGRQRWDVRVTGPGGEATVPMTLDVGAARLPYAAVATMVYVETDTIAERVGAGALAPTLQLLHRHHLTPVVPITEARQLDASPIKELLTGELFTEGAGYHGPGEGVGANVAAIGTYGTLGMPDEDTLAEVDRIVVRLDELAPEAYRFVYAVDEDCDSLRGPTWRRALAQSRNARLQGLEVGHTCSDPPSKQNVDLVMMFASAYRPALARSASKRVWIYNGVLPRTGSFLSDGWDVGLRVNPWIQAHHGIERWFYWESVFWNDSNEGGLGPYDPFATAETFHNADGDHANGDGVLVYPGRQSAEGYLDLGAERTLPSFRLAQWRRGIQDAGYLALAEQIDAARARSIRASLVGGAFEAERAPRFPVAPEPWRRARRELFELLR